MIDSRMTLEMKADVWFNLKIPFNLKAKFPVHYWLDVFWILYEGLSDFVYLY